MAFLHLVKVVRDFLQTHAKLEPESVTRIFVDRFEQFERPARYLYFRVLWKWKTSTVEREYFKTTKTHKKLIRNAMSKAPYYMYTFYYLTICNYNPSPHWSDFEPNSTFYRILRGFHRLFATGVACRQGTLTPPDTWSRPVWTYICSTSWDQSFSELVVFSRTMLFDYPSVLSRFCLAQYTKIGKFIQRFLTAAFSDLDHWRSVLKLFGHLSFIILNLCTK